ncbi:hypothetical protein BJX99DRAFT_231721 [Aspergillus californicus]
MLQPVSQYRPRSDLVWSVGICSTTPSILRLQCHDTSSSTCCVTCAGDPGSEPGPGGTEYMVTLCSGLWLVYVFMCVCMYVPWSLALGP